MNAQVKKTLESYARHVIGAVAAVAATGNTDPTDLAKAAVAALLPVAIRWANPKDGAFGRGTNEEA